MSFPSLIALNLPVNVLEDDEVIFSLPVEITEDHIVVIKNESQCFYFNDFLIQFYKIINILLDIGVPFPLPFFTNKKLKLYMFKSINTKKIDDFRDLRRIIVKRVGDLK